MPTEISREGLLFTHGTVQAGTAARWKTFSHFPPTFSFTTRVWWSSQQAHSCSGHLSIIFSSKGREKACDQNWYHMSRKRHPLSTSRDIIEYRSYFNGQTTYSKSHNLGVVKTGVGLGISDSQTSAFQRALAFWCTDYKKESLYYSGKNNLD